MNSEEKIMSELNELGNDYLQNKYNEYVICNSASNILDSIDYDSLTEEDNIRLLKTVDRLRLENLDLKNEVDYYKSYLEFLEDNYFFILKSLTNAKQMFNKIGEQNE